MHLLGFLGLVGRFGDTEPDLEIGYECGEVKFSEV